MAKCLIMLALSLLAIYSWSTEGRKCPQELQAEMLEYERTFTQQEQAGEYDAAWSISTENFTYYSHGEPARHGYQEMVNVYSNWQNVEFGGIVHCESFENDTVALTTVLYIGDYNETTAWTHAHARFMMLWKKIEGTWYADYCMSNYGPPEQSDEEFVDDENNN